LLLRDPEGALEVSAARGVDSAAHPSTFLSQSILRAVLDDHQALLLRDPRTDPRFLGSESIIALRLRSTMTVPLFDNEDVIGLIHVDTSNPFQSFDEDQLRTLALFGNLLAVKIKNARLLDELRVKARLEQEMETAAQIQRRLLPGKLTEIENYRVAARLLPCLETAGDFFHVARRADHDVELMIGDVAGKGVGAALLMSHTVSAYRVLSEEGHTLSRLMERLCRHVFASSDATRFVTLFASRLDPRSHRLDYVNGGHCPALLIKVDGTCTRLCATGPAVGLVDGGAFSEQSIQLEPGTMLCLYTDGVVEAAPHDPEPEAGNPGAGGPEFYGEERLVEALRRCAGKTPAEVISAVLDDVRKFTGEVEQDDDITLVVLQRTS
jgi:serine phosphatase RsbU (regulator of sigma subunit)